MDRIKIFIENSNVLVEEIVGVRHTTPISSNQVAWYKFEDGTRLVVVARKNHWTMEIEQTTSKSEFGIQRVKQTNSDVFFTNSDIVEKEIFEIHNS